MLQSVIALISGPMRVSMSRTRSVSGGTFFATSPVQAIVQPHCSKVFLSSGYWQYFTHPFIERYKRRLSLVTEVPTIYPSLGSFKGAVPSQPFVRRKSFRLPLKRKCEFHRSSNKIILTTSQLYKFFIWLQVTVSSSQTTIWHTSPWLFVLSFYWLNIFSRLFITPSVCETLTTS